jgi:hypothetical protein
LRRRCGPVSLHSALLPVVGWPRDPSRHPRVRSQLRCMSSAQVDFKMPDRANLPCIVAWKVLAQLPSGVVQSCLAIQPAPPRPLYRICHQSVQGNNDGRVGALPAAAVQLPRWACVTANSVAHYGASFFAAKLQECFDLQSLPSETCGATQHDRCGCRRRQERHAEAATGAPVCKRLSKLSAGQFILLCHPVRSEGPWGHGARPTLPRP